MKLRKIENRKGQVAQLPAFFQIMMLVVVFAGLTFIVLDKFIDTSYEPTTETVNLEAVTAEYFTNGTGWTLASTNRSADQYTIVALYNNTNELQLAGNYTLTDNILKNATEFEGATDLKINYTYVYDADTTASISIDESSEALYDYGIGFLGIVILVTMVYLIISIISGRKSR